MATRQKATNYGNIIPRASTFGVNVMQNSVVSTLSASTSEEYAMFPVPANCLVIGGAISGSLPASGVSGQCIVTIGTGVTNNLLGTYTISGGAALKTTILPIGVVTLSLSDDHLPYQNDVLITVNSGLTSATTSLSLYLELDYVMPGKA